MRRVPLPPHHSLLDFSLLWVQAAATQAQVAQVSAQQAPVSKERCTSYAQRDPGHPGTSRPRRRPRRWHSPWVSGSATGRPRKSGRLAAFWKFAQGYNVAPVGVPTAAAYGERGMRVTAYAQASIVRAKLPKRLQDLPSAAPPYGLSSPNPMPTTLSSVHPHPPRI